jgi:hypothetical protein
MSGLIVRYIMYIQGEYNNNWERVGVGKCFRYFLNFEPPQNARGTRISETTVLYLYYNHTAPIRKFKCHCTGHQLVYNNSHDPGRSYHVVSSRYYLSRKQGCDDTSMPSAGGLLIFLFASHGTASVHGRSLKHTGTFITYANRCHIPDLDYGWVLLGSTRTSVRLSRTSITPSPTKCRRRRPLALIALPLFLRTSHSNHISTGQSIL